MSVSPPGGRPIASPVSSGGTSGAPSVGPTGPAGRPWVIRSAAVVQALSSDDQLGARARRDVERREVQAVLGRGDDAGLVLAAEGVRRGVPVAAVGAVDAAVVAVPGTAGEAGRDAGDPGGAADQAASGDVELGDGSLLLSGRSGQHGRGQVGQRLGQGVDRVGEPLDLGPAELGVEHVAVAGLVLGQQPVDLGEPLGQRLRQGGVALARGSA